MRGLNRLQGRPVDATLSQDRALSEMRAIYKIVRSETGVAMDFSDVPNILCETDKYLRVKNGELLTTDGPFAEGKEHVGGFWVIKVNNLDEALKWGARATQACRVPIEVRPFQDEAED